jgi:very-short-patch-repair endonuclease
MRSIVRRERGGVAKPRLFQLRFLVWYFANSTAPLLPSPLRGGVGGGGPQTMTNMFGSHAMSDRQRQFAQQMRAQPTDAERALWQRLRHDVVLAGSHFRRQAVIGPFIVDFASRKAKIVIELDGGQHDWQQASDSSRQRQIEAAGYRMLRFWNNDVLGNLEGVMSEIQCALPRTPDPSPQGGGEPRQRRPRRPRKESH